MISLAIVEEETTGTNWGMSEGRQFAVESRSWEASSQSPAREQLPSSRMHTGCRGRAEYPVQTTRRPGNTLLRVYASKTCRPATVQEEEEEEEEKLTALSASAPILISI